MMSRLRGVDIHRGCEWADEESATFRKLSLERAPFISTFKQ